MVCCLNSLCFVLFRGLVVRAIVFLVSRGSIAEGKQQACCKWDPHYLGKPGAMLLAMAFIRTLFFAVLLSFNIFFRRLCTSTL